MHRIGQTRPVAISYLLASSTFDEVIYERGHTKREAASTLLGIGGQSERLAGLLKGVITTVISTRLPVWWRCSSSEDL